MKPDDARRPKRPGRPRMAARATETPFAAQFRVAALKQFAANGFHGVTLKAIAAEVGVSDSLIIHKFGSKLALWQAAVDDISKSLLTALHRQPTAPAATDAGPALAGALAQIIDIVCDTPYLAAFAVHEVAHQEDERFGYFFARLIKPIRDDLLPHILRAQAAGVLGSVSPDFYFVNFASSVLMTVVSRPLIGRLANGASTESAFRAELKQALLGKL